MRNVFSASHPPSHEFIEETWKLITHDKGKSMIPRLIRYMTERKINRDRWVNPLVEKVIPIKLINGMEDPISGKHMAQRFDEVVPNANISLIENSGHYPHIETPEEVLEAFLNFHQSEQH